MYLAIICDFDGTIAAADTNREILEAFADPAWLDVENAWLRGEIGSRECIQRQYALVRASRVQVESLLDGIAVDPHFAAFVTFCSRRRIPLAVASDGVDLSLSRILGRVADHQLPVFCNQIQFGQDGTVSISFPNYAPTCTVSSGTCKCAVLQNALPANARKLLIGDGVSDFCVASKVDFVLAKDLLADHCARNGIAYMPYRDFADVREIVERMLTSADAACIRPH